MIRPSSSITIAMVTVSPIFRLESNLETVLSKSFSDINSLARNIKRRRFCTERVECQFDFNSKELVTKDKETYFNGYFSGWGLNSYQDSSRIRIINK